MAITLTTSYQRISTIYLTYGEVRTYAKYSSQSVANNQTEYQLKTTYYTGQATLSFSSASITTDGSTNSYGYTTLYRGETTLQELSKILNHNADGTSPTKEINTIWNASFGGSGSSSNGITAPTILRNATITDAPDFSDEDNPTITYSNPAGTNVSSLQACISLTGEIDDIEYRDISKTGTSYTFELTDSERNVLRNATPDETRKVKFFIKTVIGGATLYSNVEKTFTYIARGRIRVNGEWKQGKIYIMANGEWKKATPYIRASNEWKRGI